MHENINTNNNINIALVILSIKDVSDSASAIYMGNTIEGKLSPTSYSNDYMCYYLSLLHIIDSSCMTQNIKEEVDQI